MNIATPDLTNSRAWWAVLLLETALLLAPLFIAEYPPVCDLINHEARLYILSGGDVRRVLSRFYQPDWHIVPNLGMDLLGLALLRLMSLSSVGRLLLAMNLLLCLGGTIVYHRALFRRRAWWPLAVGLVLYSGSFLLGFINFLLSTGLALLAAAAARSRTAQLRRLRLPLAALSVIVLFIFHIFGLIFYLVLIASQEAAEIDWRSLRARPRTVLLPPLMRLAVPGLTACTLVALARHPAGRVPIYWATHMQQLTFAASPFVSYSRILYGLTLAIFASALAMFASLRAIRVPVATIVALVILAVLYAISPFSVANGNYIGMRFATFISLLLFAGIDISSPRPRLLAATGALLAALIVVRTAYLGEIWRDSRRDIAQMRAAGAFLPPGATVLVVETRPEENRGAYYRDQPQAREIPGVYSAFIYLPSLWVIERQIFFPLIFTIPTLQPLRITESYRDLAVPFGVPPDYRLLYDPEALSQELRSAPYLKDWPKHFDFVAILSSGRAQHLDAINHPPLQLLYNSDVVSLYKVAR